MFKRAMIVVAVAAAALIGGAVWLFTRGEDGQASPAEAVVKTCHPDPFRPLHDYADAVGTNGARLFVQGMTMVTWYPRGGAQPEVAGLRRAGDGHWIVVECKIHFALGDH